LIFAKSLIVYLPDLSGLWLEVSLDDVAKALHTLLHSYE